MRTALESPQALHSLQAMAMLLIGAVKWMKVDLDAFSSFPMPPPLRILIQPLYPFVGKASQLLDVSLVEIAALTMRVVSCIPRSKAMWRRVFA
jgi:hypothetical protein